MGDFLPFIAYNRFKETIRAFFFRYCGSVLRSDKLENLRNSNFNHVKHVRNLINL